LGADLSPAIQIYPLIFLIGLKSLRIWLIALKYAFLDLRQYQAICSSTFNEDMWAEMQLENFHLKHSSAAIFGQLLITAALRRKESNISLDEAVIRFRNEISPEFLEELNGTFHQAACNLRRMQLTGNVTSAKIEPVSSVSEKNQLNAVESRSMEMPCSIVQDGDWPLVYTVFFSLLKPNIRVSDRIPSIIGLVFLLLDSFPIYQLHHEFTTGYDYCLFISQVLLRTFFILLM